MISDYCAKFAGAWCAEGTLLEGDVRALILERLNYLGFLDTNFGVFSFLRRMKGTFISAFASTQITSGFLASW